LPGTRDGRVAALAFALTSALLIAAAPAADSATPLPPQLALRVAPAVIDAQATGPGALPVISIRNESQVGFRLAVAPALAAQALEGGLKPLGGRRNDALAKRMVRLQGPRFLGPGQTVDVHPFFRSYAGRRSVSIAVVIVGVPVKQPRRGITYRLKLLGAIFVHRPEATAKATIDWVRVSRLGTLRRQLTVRVRNRGDAPAFITRVRFRVLNAQGRVIASVRGQPGFIVPRSVRDFAAGLFRRLPAGRVQVEAIVRSGTQETRRSAFLASRR
jgi:hypothetical protein